MLQKSVVGPIFFIDDLPLNGTNSDVDIYADYAKLTFSSRWNANKSLMTLYIDEDLAYVVNRSKMDKMGISQTKRKSILVVESDNGNDWTVLKLIWNLL